MFSDKGRITDVQLKYTNEGKFRKFGFVGYQTEEEAATAKEYFGGACIDTSRIDVQVCAALGDDQKPQSWSKYAKDSSIFKKLNGISDEDDKEKKQKEKAEKKKKGKKDRLEEIFGEHKNDPKFIEFMKAHGNGNEIWDNDLGVIEQTEEDVQGGASKQASKDESDHDQGGGSSKNDESEISTKLADQSISDADYLKTLKEIGSSAAKQVKTDGERKINDLFTIKIREIPFKTKRKDVTNFFKPIKVYSIRLPTRKHGFCYVGFKTEKEFNKAMLKNRSFLQGKQVILIDFTEKNKLSAAEKEESTNDKKSKSNPKWAKQEEALKNEEDISESGKIFFRNLTYTVTEEQLQELFGKYGPVADIHLPIDTVTRRIKGFGTVTYVMPENAVQAFSELDGSTFQGRLLHLIPGKSSEEDEINTDGMSFKEKKEFLQKKTAGSSHNWNTLFMGTNAIVNTLSKNYQASKEAILDMNEGGSGAAVRLALGETEIVMEMRKFLEANDVLLDAFQTTSKKRSRTVILVKNLPAETTVSEIQTIFSKFGLVGRCVLPPSGITAIVEFLDAVEAKKAFSKLAYTKFKNLPLYLEWAPDNLFKTNATKPLEATKEIQVEKIDERDFKTIAKDNPFSKLKDSKTTKSTHMEEPEESYVVNEEAKPKPNITKAEPEYDDEDDTEPEPGTTLFLRNLKFTTEAETVREHFKHIGKIHHIQIAIKKDPDNPRIKTSLGYGFIQFKQQSSLEKALKQMQTTDIDGNTVELKRSDRTLQ